jgi:hypothetical protein
MATKRDKGKSPFYPGQPVPPEFFVGRQEQIDKILIRGASQVAAGKPITMYVQGEYGIGKSSIASYVQRLAEREKHLLRIYANLGGAHDLAGLATKVIEATMNAGAGAVVPSRGDKIREWLAKYVGKQELFGLTVNLEALKADAPRFTTPSQMLKFLAETLSKVKDTGIKGLFLVLDELNGIADTPDFAHFIKGLVEENAMSAQPLPLLLMLCGVEERRRQMIKHHQPVDRIFDIIDIELMSPEEMTAFYTKAFNSVQITVRSDAMHTLVHYAAGFPKIMHLIGDEAYWIDEDGILGRTDASKAVVEAAEEVGKKYVDQQVYKALRSTDYHSILRKIASLGPEKTTFTKKEILDGLTDSEKKKLNNFLQKMKRLNVIRSGDVAGEYVFIVRMVRFYIWLESTVRSQKSKKPPVQKPNGTKDTGEVSPGPDPAGTE